MDFQLIIYFVTYFLIYSFFGWVLESITKTVTQKKFVNSGFLYGPFCPIYGIGAVGMALILKSFQGHYVLTFIVSFFVFSAWEYFVGWLLEKLFNTKYWDYSYYKLNIKGRVCFVNSLTWGFLGVAFTELIHPVVSYSITSISTNIINPITIMLIIYIIIDLIITAIKIKDINLSISRFSEISNNIKIKIEELKSLPEKAKNNEKIKNTIDELKEKQNELKKSIERKTERLRMAFPNMKLDKLNDILKRKTDKKQEKNKRN